SAASDSDCYSDACAAAIDAGSYDVVVSGTCSPSQTSSAATLTVNTAPNITSSPLDATKCVGDSVTFSVSATGTALHYQWRKGGKIGRAARKSASYTMAGA